jgi:hypothetical protein
MKQRPILFQGGMVRALLDGSKTQTRRIVKPQPEFVVNNLPCRHTPDDEKFGRLGVVTPCPYGQPGDRLIVRETWQYDNWTEDGYPWIGYQADGTTRLCDRIPSEEWSARLMDIWAGLSEEKNFAIDGRAADRRWRPSIHMPRWASRITLEISEEDAIAEGLWHPPESKLLYLPCADTGKVHVSPRRAYCDLWQSINGADSWAANSWVWVVEFKRLTGAQ